MRVLITGITGFAGSHLADYLLAEHPEVEIFGTRRWRSQRRCGRRVCFRASIELPPVQTQHRRHRSLTGWGSHDSDAEQCCYHQNDY